ncbi:MAG: patatin-like phospholipase family protein [Minisyncoccia bacterium]
MLFDVESDFEFEGDLGVLENFLIKQELYEAGDPAHEEIRSELYIDGGGTRCTCSAGHGRSLEKNGVFEIMDAVYATSGGFPVALGAATGQVQELRDVFWEYCSREEFFSRERMFRKGQAMNIDGLTAHLRKKIKVVNMHQSRMRLYGALTCAETGAGVVVDVKKSIDPLNDMRAAIAMPWFSHGNVEIGGKSFLDGAGAYPFLARLALHSNATDVLVLANSPKGEGPNAFGGLAASMFLRSMPEKVRRVFETQSQRYQESLAEFRKSQKFRKLILWMGKKIKNLGPFEQDSEKLKAASYAAEHFLDNLIAKCRLRKCA